MAGSRKFHTQIAEMKKQGQLSEALERTRRLIESMGRKTGSPRFKNQIMLETAKECFNKANVTKEDIERINKVYLEQYTKKKISSEDIKAFSNLLEEAKKKWPQFFREIEEEA